MRAWTWAAVSVMTAYRFDNLSSRSPRFKSASCKNKCFFLLSELPKSSTLYGTFPFLLLDSEKFPHRNQNCISAIKRPFKAIITVDKTEVSSENDKIWSTFTRHISWYYSRVLTGLSPFRSKRDSFHFCMMPCNLTTLSFAFCVRCSKSRTMSLDSSMYSQIPDKN